MYDILKYLTILVLCLVLYYIGLQIRAWNCDRVGMDYDIFIQGCVVRGVK